MPGVLVIVVLIAIGAIVAATIHAREQLKQSWGSVADRLGLTLNPATWRKPASLEGEVDGYPLTVDIHRRGSGQHKSSWTRFRLGVPALDLGLELKEAGFFSAVSKAFGSQDIEVGDARFDDRLIVKGRDADAVRAFLNPERRARIGKFFESHRGAVINDQEVTWSKRGRMTQTSKMLATIEEMLLVGRSLAGGERPSDPLATLAMATSAAATTAAAAAAAPAVADTVAPELEPALEPPPEIEGVPETVPELPAEPEPDRAAEADVTADPVIAEAMDGTVDAAEFCDTVFRPGAFSFEVTRIFEDRFRGQRVVWSGALEAAEPYSFDFVFGARNGVRGTFAIHQVAGHTIGDGEVKAVIQLPAETQGLDARIGESVSFSGTLTKVDALSRKVFLTEASLTA